MMMNAKTEAQLQDKIETLEAHMVRNANLIGNQEAEIVSLREALESVTVARLHDMKNIAVVALASTSDYEGNVVVDKEKWDNLANNIKAMRDTAKSNRNASTEMNFEDGVVSACSTLLARLDSLRGGEG